MGVTAVVGSRRDAGACNAVGGVRAMCGAPWRPRSTVPQAPLLCTSDVRSGSRSFALSSLHPVFANTPLLNPLLTPSLRNATGSQGGLRTSASLRQQGITESTDIDRGLSSEEDKTACRDWRGAEEQVVRAFRGIDVRPVPQ